MNVHSLLKIAALVFLFYLAYCGLLFALQRSVLFPRNQIPFAPKSENNITGLEKLWIETEYGKTEAWYLAPDLDSTKTPAPAVIFGHGNAELIDFWPQTLKNFNQMGIGLLLVEYPGYGRSAGTPSQKSIANTFVAAYDALASRKDVDSSRIVLFGRSLGGGAVCDLALQRPSAALILMSSFTSVSAMASKFLVPKFLVRDPFNNLKTVKSYPGPILVIHGRSDRIIPFDHGTRLHAAAKDSTLIAYAAGHNDCPPDWSQFWKDIALFLNDHKII
jgi:hypothetical protein